MPGSAAGPESPGWRSRDILRTAALIAGVYVALQLLWVGRSVFLLGFLGVLLGLTLSVAVDRLHRLGLPRGIAAPLIVLVLAGVLVGFGWLAAPRIGEQLRDLRAQLPEAVQRVEGWVQERVGGMVRMLQPDSPAAPEGQGRNARPEEVSLREGVAQQASGVARRFFAFFSSTLAALAGALVIVFVAIFVAADPGLYHGGLMHLFPHRARKRAGEVLSAVATTLRRWLVAQLLAMLAIGVVTTVTLLLLDVKAALALGLIAGLLEFIPYVGPILSAVPAVGMALLDGPEKALSVVLAYTAIQQLEGVVLQPLLMKEGLELPPVITILGQALFGLVFGFVGLLVAVPLLGAVMVPIKMLYVRDVVGDEVPIAGEAASA